VLEIGHEMTSDEKFEDYKKLSDKLNDIYEMLPDELVIKDRWKDAKILAVDKFTFR
jgi:hypothetical protein